MNVLIFIISAAITASYANPAVTRITGSFNKYYVYTREKYYNSPAVIDTTDSTTIASSVKDILLPGRKTAIIVHGHQGSATTSLNPTVKNAFLYLDDFNVIVVDWSLFASLSYSNAARVVPEVGAHLASIITELTKETIEIQGEQASGIKLETIHLVGFDLGAHVVGFTGRALDGKIPRITGLNPSGNGWGVNSQRLRASDALYVEVIHTDAGGLFGNGVGDAIGDVDFFANGGSGQPGCFMNNYCSHNRAWELFAATLTHNHLVGQQCGNRLQLSLNICRGFRLTMGNNDFIKYGFGIFRVNTGRTYPF